MKDVRQPTGNERRRASKLFLRAAKLYEQGKFEEALEDDQKAAELDPANENYRMAVEVARAHAVTALIQAAAKARIQGDTLGARSTLARAYEIDPRNPQLAQHLGELGESPLPGDPQARNERVASGLGELETLQPNRELHTFHFHANTRQIIPDVFRAYGIEVSLDESIRGQTIRFDIDDASFEQATHALSMVTKSFFEAYRPAPRGGCPRYSGESQPVHSQRTRDGIPVRDDSDGDDRHRQHGEECVRNKPVGG